MSAALPVTRYHQSIDEIDDQIACLFHTINTAQYELLVLIREFDERMGWLKWGAKNCAEWLQWRCDLSAVAAREKVRVAKTLVKLPEIAKAFSTGKLSYTKVRALTRIATVENEAELLSVALRLSAANVESYCRQIKNVSVETTTVAKDANQQRLCSSWTNEDKGMTSILIKLPQEEGLLFEQALEKAVRMVQSDAPTPGEDTPWTAVRADAVVAMASEFLSGSCDSGNTSKKSAADLYQVVVHVDEAALSPTAESTSEKTSQSELPAETVRRLCCDGGVVPLVESACGEPLNVGRRQRTVPIAIRRALWARDRGCAFPGCSHTRFVDAHHIQHWADGGETSVENCCLLCSRHHKLVHEGGYSVIRSCSGDLNFQRPDGRLIPATGYRSIDHSVVTTEEGVSESSGGYEVVDLFLRKQLDSKKSIYDCAKRSASLLQCRWPGSSCAHRRLPQRL